MKQQVAVKNLGSNAGAAALQHAAAVMRPEEYGDKVMPHFMVTKLPTGCGGVDHLRDTFSRDEYHQFRNECLGHGFHGRYLSAIF